MKQSIKEILMFILCLAIVIFIGYHIAWLLHVLGFRF